MPVSDTEKRERETVVGLQYENVQMYFINAENPYDLTSMTGIVVQQKASVVPSGSINV
jgi:hypothetical protein